MKGQNKVTVQKRVMNGSLVKHIYVGGRFAGTIRKLMVGKQWTDEIGTGSEAQMKKKIVERYKDGRPEIQKGEGL